MTQGTDNSAAVALRLAVDHHQAGRLAEAEAAYRQVLAVYPNQADAVFGLGTLALQVHKYDVAAELIRRAIGVNGEWAEACYHLGMALGGMDQLDQAIVAYRRAIVLKPALVGVRQKLAYCLQISGERDKALVVYEQAIALEPDDPQALFNYSIALHGAGRLDESIAALRRAIAAKPDYSDGFNNLGAALRGKGNLDEAISAFRRACELTPEHHQAHVNLTAALWDAGRIDEAIAAGERAVAQRPGDAGAHCALGSLLMLNGDWQRGLAHLEWRWQEKTAVHWPRRRFWQPLWDGADLAGRTIYLHGERSIGDTIQFSRFIPLVVARGGKVVVECQGSLRRLFEGQWDVAEWFSPGEALPEFDVYCPLSSLLLVMGIDRESVPAEPYLRVDPQWPRPWRKSMSEEGGALKVGLVWAGNPSEPANRKRSAPFSRLLRLGEIPGVEYFSLQKGLGDAPAGMKLSDFTDELHNWADTAAAIEALDLVITVDTGVAHLAGAMGKALWMLLPFVPHWRWGLKSDRSPWYPTLRLFRQSRRGEWDDVVERVAASLAELAGNS